MPKTPLRIALAAFVLGVATFVVVGVAEAYLPYSEAKIWVIDALTVAGALIAGIVYPQGVHTGTGSSLWGFWVMVANLATYTVIWYACLLLAQYAKNVLPKK